MEFLLHGASGFLEWFKGRVAEGPRVSCFTVLIPWFTQSHPAIIQMLDSVIIIIYFAIS